jgi:hypothetical protein
MVIGCEEREIRVEAEGSCVQGCFTERDVGIYLWLCERLGW